MRAHDLFEGPLDQSNVFESNPNRAVSGVSVRTANRRLLVGTILATALTIHVGLAASSTGNEDLRPVISAGDFHPEVAEWHRFVQQLNPDEVGTEVLHGILEFTNDVIKPLATVPRSGLAPGGSYILEWDFGEHHLEVEIFADETYDWFYRNSKTGRLDGQDGLRLDGNYRVFKRRLKKYSG